jgi:hypothetical protein
LEVLVVLVLVAEAETLTEIIAVLEEMAQKV